MNNEIKEISEDLKQHTWLEYEEMDKLLDYITNLHEENERLKKDYDRLMQNNTYTLELERRNEKAIEHIKQNIKNDTFTEWYDGDFEELLNILQGGDK